MPPFLGGGHMIARVGDFESTWAEPPAKFEAGTMPVAEAIGLGAAVDWLTETGMDAVREHGRDVTAYALERLAEVEGLKIHGTTDLDQRGSLVSFAVDGIHPHDVAEILGREGVCVRAGHHCAQPLMRRLGAPASTRASIAIHNTHEDIDRLIDAPRHGAGDVRLAMDDLYRENILEHYKRPHHWGELEDPDIEFFDTNPLCGDELKVQIKVADGKVVRRRLLRPRLRDLAGLGLDGLRRADRHAGRGPAQARQGLRARPAGDRHLRDAHQVRAAVAEGHQVRGPRPRRGLGDRGLRTGERSPPRLVPARRLSGRRGAAWASPAAAASARGAAPAWAAAAGRFLPTG